MAITLNFRHKHILKLIDRDKNGDGWTVVSDVLYSHLVKDMPSELVEFSDIADNYKARLTTEGQNIIEAMAWL